MKFLIINGPNLNMLGIREPDLYGTLTYDGLVEYVAAEARRLGVEAEFYQSNHEGDLVTAIQQAYGRMDGIVINAGAYTHTSIAILDALKAVSVPAAEVHISDVAKREDFRQVSYLGMACCCKFAGEGKQGYVHAMEKLIEIIRSKNYLEYKKSYSVPHGNGMRRRWAAPAARHAVIQQAEGKESNDHQHKTGHSGGGTG